MLGGTGGRQQEQQRRRQQQRRRRRHASGNTDYRTTNTDVDMNGQPVGGGAAVDAGSVRAVVRYVEQHYLYQHTATITTTT